jgi:hypothetical protein
MPRIYGKTLARWTGRVKNTAAGCVSSLEFLERVQNAIIGRDLPNISFSYITRREGGWFSPRRIYLRVRFERLFFDVFGFVIGNEMTTGWWLHEDSPGITDLLAEIPGMGFVLENMVPHRSETYYRVDFIESAQRLIHESVLQVIDDLSAESGGQFYLPDEERQPIWEEIW